MTEALLPVPSDDDLAAALEWNVRYWAWKREMTLDELAQKASVSRAGLYAVLARETDPSVGQVAKIAAALDVAAAELISWDGEVFRLGLPQDAWPRKYKNVRGRVPPAPNSNLKARKRYPSGLKR